jgi:HAMP domain-containing protein
MSTIFAEALTEAFAGSAGGLLATAVVYPLELLKVRIQTQLANKMTNYENTGSSEKKNSTGNKSILSIAKELIKTQGIQGLYYGFWLKAAGCVYDDLIYFFVYRLIERNLKSIINMIFGRRSNAVTIATDFIVGSLAGCVQFFITIPVETITVNIQSQTSMSSIYNTMQELYKKNGIRGFWRGYSISCLLTCNPAINFGVFEWLKKLQLNGRNNDLLASTAFFLGTVSKAIAISITYPLIRIKILSQALASRRQGDITLDLAGEIIEEQGLSGLYTGLTTQILRSSIAAGIMFATRERTRAFMTGILMSLVGSSKN